MNMAVLNTYKTSTTVNRQDSRYTDKGIARAHQQVTSHRFLTCKYKGFLTQE